VVLGGRIICGRGGDVMIRKIKIAIKSVIRKLGFELVRNWGGSFPPDFESRHKEIIKKVSPYTITCYERQYALIEAVEYIVRNRIKGDLVECGVFRGGSMMCVALTLLRSQVNDRDLFLFDTFEGMPKPGERDISLFGTPAIDEFNEKRISDVSSRWTNAPIEDVREVMESTGYPLEKIHFVKGLVEETLPKEAPNSIALLRLDTDWYQSTKHELVHLYPRLSVGGVLIVDDYGCFLGAREAVNEYFSENKISPLLHRIDYSGRTVLKVSL
jgi:hypothetical protein